MGRVAVLSNGNLAVGINESGLVHDFYYPYVGQDNLTNARSNPHMIGVWADGEFSWINDGTWQSKFRLSDKSMASVGSATNKKLGVELEFYDFVHPEINILCRRITVKNISEEEKDIRMFNHQVFQISRDGRSDTALYVPDSHYILDYKGACSILAYSESGISSSFDQHAVGNTGIEGKEGTFRDAEDGELSNSDVEHASVDSTIRTSLRLAPREQQDVRYWLIAADSQYELERIHNTVVDGGFDALQQQNDTYWSSWLARSNQHVDHLPDEYIANIRRSLLTIKAHIDNRGGIIASLDSSIFNYNRDYYSYVWPRDGAYVIWPLIRMGYTDEAKRFFEFSRDVIHPDGYLRHKYQPDKSIGSTWHPLRHNNSVELAIQEDETASVVYMIAEFYANTSDLDYIKAELYDSLLRPACNFMANYVDEETGLPHASYDLWEQKFLTNTYSVALVTRALASASEIAMDLGHEDDAIAWKEAADGFDASCEKLFSPDAGHYSKGYILEDGELQYDNTLDISTLYATSTYQYGDQEYEDKTLQAIEAQLWNKQPVVGTTRFTNDEYFKSEPMYQGNPWFVASFWMVQYYIVAGKQDKAREIIDWANTHMDKYGLLSEQVNPTNGEPTGVSPLVWSHAEYVNTLFMLK